MTARRPLLLTVAASLLLTGCGPETKLKLDLRPVSITVPRLVTPAVTIVPATPPAVAALPPLPAVDLALPSLPPAASGGPLPSAPPVERCPEADQFAVPAVPASIVVNRPPGPATYTHLTTGTYATGATTGSLGGAQRVVVTALPRQTSAVGQVVDSWSVARAEATGPATSLEVYRLVHPSTAPGATAAGIYLAGLSWQDAARGELSFRPVGGGLFVLPSPVSLSASGGTQYTGTATDPSTLTTLSIVRNVTGKKRVDACGDLIDTYTVEITGVLTTATSQRQVTWNLQLATAYGGVQVQDALTLTDPGGTFRWSQVRTTTQLPKEVAL